MEHSKKDPKEDYSKDLIEVITSKVNPVLLKRGDSVSVEGQLSYPVEIFWMENDAENPFLPSSE